MGQPISQEGDGLISKSSSAVSAKTAQENPEDLEEFENKIDAFFQLDGVNDD